MKSYHETVEDITAGKIDCPLPLEVIPNHMGINLCAVRAISWITQDDGQLTNLVIHFIPDGNP